MNLCSRCNENMDAREWVTLTALCLSFLVVVFSAAAMKITYESGYNKGQLDAYEKLRKGKE